MAWYEARKSGGAGADQLAIIASGNVFDYSDLQTHTQTIPNYAFSNNLGIRDIISSDVVTVKQNAFYNCNNVRAISLPNCTRIEQSAFDLVRNTYTNVVAINLPLCEYIGNYGFSDYRGVDLTAEIVLPSCTELGEKAFYSQGATQSVDRRMKVKSFSLPAIRTIGNNAFSYLVATTVTIGENCTSMGTQPFVGAEITELIMQRTSPPTLNTSAGLGTGAVIGTIYVPDGSVSAYVQNSRWNQYESIIKPISDRPTT